MTRLGDGARMGAAVLVAWTALTAPLTGVAHAETGDTGGSAVTAGSASARPAARVARPPRREARAVTPRAAAARTPSAPRPSDSPVPQRKSRPRALPAPAVRNPVEAMPVSWPAQLPAAAADTPVRTVTPRHAPRAVAAVAPAAVSPPPARAAAGAVRADRLTGSATRLDRLLQSALGLLARLPKGPVSDLLTGALLLVKRNLTPQPTTVAPHIGINMSTELADPAPTYRAVVAAIKAQGITSIRMYEIVPAALNQIQAQIPGAKVTVAVPNSSVEQLASDPDFATSVVDQLKPYGSMVTAVSVGNEVDAAPFDLATVTRAVKNMQGAIAAAKLPIATTVSFTMSLIQDSYPPSRSVLNTGLDGLLPLLRQLTDYVEIDIYPLMDIQDQPADIKLAYALGNPTSPPIYDNGVAYHSLFWAEYDAVRWALNKAGITIPLRVGETGWATNSVGGRSIYSNVTNARIYNQNVVDSMAGGSPKFGVKNVPFYFFELIDENQKTGGIFEPYWGWYAVTGLPGSVTLTQKYPLTLSLRV